MSVARDQALIQIQQQYARIPTFTCIPGCNECCGVVPFTESEWALLTPEEQAKPLVSARCQFATETGCSIYERRPLLCRLFGTVNDQKMTCWKGCGPEQKLTAQQGRTIMRKYLQHPRAQDPLRDLTWATGLLKKGE